MKKAIIALAIIFGLLTTISVFAKPVEESEIYPLTTKVLRVDRENDIVVCIDCNGNFWEFEGAEDWMEGDCATLLMNDCATETIFDDVIEDVRYSTWELN